MYAVEFEACIDNGFVRIPEEYKTLQNSKHAKIIVMIEEPIKATDKLVFSEFLQHSRKVENLAIFNRDSLHER